MGVPRGGRTKSKQGQRRSHLALKNLHLSECSHCHRSVLPHRLCAKCGYYGNKPVVDVMAKLSKREKKKKSKEMAKTK